MSGSSESGWHRSDSSRGLNWSAVSDRNPRLIGGDTPHDSSRGLNSGCIQGRRETNHVKTRVGGVVSPVECRDVSLRQWLDNPERGVDGFDCLHIFAQIVEIVNLAHSQGVVVRNVRPSCFVMSSFNRVAFIESASCSDSGSDSFDDVSNREPEFKELGSVPPNDLEQAGRELGNENLRNLSQMVSETSCLQSGSENAPQLSLKPGNVEQTEVKKLDFPMKQILHMETNWYSSPEEVAGASSSCASDIYRLGVVLFELFCTFSSIEEKSSTMSSLRHRVLPTQLLLKWPKEASFCLWLLHPEPSSRPKMGELLQSEFLNDPRDNIKERKAQIELREKIGEQELLLEFLLMMQRRKQEAANILHETVSFLSSDIEEVTKMQTSGKKKGNSVPCPGDLAPGLPSRNIIDNGDSGGSATRKRFRQGLQVQNTEEFDGQQDEYQESDTPAEDQGKFLSRSSRLMKSFKKVESAYFINRRRALKQSGKPFTRHSPLNTDGRGFIVGTERNSVNNLSIRERYIESRQSGWINSFLEGLCKYLSFSKLKVKADLRQGDLLNSSNLVCSLSFDRDGEFFATAGVNKKIKVFEYDSVSKENRDIHYPVVEMASRSKLSSICWNGYIKSQIASSNFDGVVQVWDVSRNQLFMEMREHERRVWSVNYSLADPTLLASGSDDGSVKLWNINQGVSVGSIKTKANVCCVQFPSDSSNTLAFGSADHNIYYYDLRNSKAPLCTFIGHNKTVSYVKFIDSTNVVSASTDNTIKLWDLSMSTSRVIDCPLQSFTGHVNIKNFVGLSVSDGYIATGSETNEVFVYHKAFPMHALSYKFNSTDPLSGEEVDDASQFISSVCWRTQSNTLVAANSLGNIKLLDMV